MRVWLVVLALLASAASADQKINVEAHRDGDAVLVEASATVGSDLHLAWVVLTGYDHYADFVPDLKSSTVLSRIGNMAVVEQMGTAGFFLFRFPLEVRLEVVEEPNARVTAHAVAGNFKEMTGVYQLVPDGDMVRFTYSGRLVPSFRLPPLIGTIAIRQAVQKQFSAIVHEILRRQGSAAEGGS